MPESAPGQGYVLELCAKKAAYEATPERELSLDLDQVAEALEGAGIPVLTNAGVLLVAQAGPVELSIFESGRLLLKTDQRELASQVSQATYELLEAVA